MYPRLETLGVGFFYFNTFPNYVFVKSAAPSHWFLSCLVNTGGTQN